MSDFNPEDEPQLLPRYPYARPGPIPDFRLEGLLQEGVPSLTPRDSSSSTSSVSSSTFTSCGPKDTTGPCERSTSATDNTTIPIVLGVMIPLGVAFIAMFILHRRHVRKLRKEDAEDEQKSLDFGLAQSGPNNKGKKGKKVQKGQKGPEMSMADTRNALRRDHGLSMDMGLTNPYLLPPGLHQSRESLHSLSRSLHTGDDKYRATDFIPDDGSIRSPSVMRRSPDDSSSFTGSSKPRFDTESSKTLLRTNTSDTQGAFHKEVGPAPPAARKPPPPSKDNLLVPAGADARDSYVSTASSNGAASAFRKSNDYLSAFIRGGGLGGRNDAKSGSKQSHTGVTEVKPEPQQETIRVPAPAITRNDEPAVPQRSLQPVGRQPEPPQRESERLSVGREPRLPQLSFIDSSGNSNKDFLNPQILTSESSSVSEPATAHTSVQSPPQHDSQYYNPQFSTESAPRQDGQHYEQYQQHHQYDEYYGNQPVPEVRTQQYETEDDYYDPEDTYSVYDDYEEMLGYDARRSTMGMRPLPPDDPSENPEQRANRIRSFYKEYFDESSKSPNVGQNMGYYDGTEYFDDYYAQDAYYPPRGHSSAGGRHRAFSHGSHVPGPRAFSSASGRYGPGQAPPHARMPPKKKMAAPKALNALPTPSKLKDDTFLIDQSIDFAPPMRAVVQRSGTPDSLRGGQRPYSPAVRAYTPLASSFDDLAVMPSPHQLRKSGVFTSLDFAPPRFRANDSGSDSGSIRSNRSGVSAVHRHNIRKGAYRVSKIPKTVVGSHDEISAALKPRWDMNR